MNLELGALLWLANTKRCMLVVRELSPRTPWCGEPDAYGVTAARYSIEVEIKRSMSDLYADKQKHSRRNREHYPHWFPKYFFYLMPEDLAVKAKNAIPQWAGLLSMGEWGVINTVIDAPKNKESKRLSIKECVLLSKQMAIYSTRMEEKYDSAVKAWKNGMEPYYWSYQI